MAEQEDNQGQPEDNPPPLPTLLKLADTNPYTKLSDITTDNGRRLWRQATEPLSDKFDGSHQHFQNFSAAITNRFKMCNWFRFITFTIEGISRELVTNPGMISLETVAERRTTRAQTLDNPPNPAATTTTIAQVEDYNNAVITHVQCTMMYHFLANSITTPLQTHISQKIMSGLIHEDGPLLLKYIQEKVKGRANKQAVLNARSALLNLNLKEFKYNIKRLHDHVNTQVLTITSNGGQIMGDGITAALLTTYKSCTNDEFLHTIRHMEAISADQDKDINYQDLMVKAETVYDTLCQKKKWGKKDPRDEQILALQTKVEELSKRKKTSSNNNNSSSSTRKNNNNSSSSSQKKRRYPNWRYEKPKDGKKHIQKEVKGKTVDFWWCEALEMWARHKPDECKASKKQEATKNTNKGSSSSTKPRLQVAQSAAYTMSDDDEDEE